MRPRGKVYTVQLIEGEIAYAGNGATEAAAMAAAKAEYRRRTGNVAEGARLQAMQQRLQVVDRIGGYGGRR